MIRMLYCSIECQAPRGSTLSIHLFTVSAIGILLKTMLFECSARRNHSLYFLLETSSCEKCALENSRKQSWRSFRPYPEPACSLQAPAG